MKVKTYGQSEFYRELNKAIQEESERLQESFRKESEDIGKQIIDRVLHVVLFAVWDTVPGITTEQLYRVLEVVEEKAEYISNRDISYDDIKQVLKDEANLTIS